MPGSTRIRWTGALPNSWTACANCKGRLAPWAIRTRNWVTSSRNLKDAFQGGRRQEQPATMMKTRTFRSALDRDKRKDLPRMERKYLFQPNKQAGFSTV